MTPKPIKTGGKVTLVANFTDEEQARLKEHYETLNKNLELGEDFYGVSERLNKYDPIKAEMQNYEMDFHINEIGMDGKEAVFRECAINSRIPKEFHALANLPVCKKGLLAKNRLQTVITAVRTFRKSSDFFDIYIDEDMKESKIKEINKELEILRDERSDLIVFPTRNNVSRRVIRVKPFDPATDTEHEKEWGYKKDYFHFVLKKVDMPLRKPINFLAEVLGINPQSFEIAQMKEALPTSHQWISVERPINLQGLIDTVKPKSGIGFRIGNIDIRNKPLEMGDLKGNKYRIALRGLEIESTSTVVECLDHLKDVGFINYFGEKRFMSRKLLATAEVGKLLLTRSWKEAVELILKPTNEDPSEIKLLKEKWMIFEGDTEKLFLKDTKSNEFEFKMMKKLKVKPDDYIGALEEIPLGIRLGFLYAYQSYIWNVIVSQRIKRKGLKLEEGDIVWIGKDTNLKQEFYEDYSLAFVSRSVPKEGINRDVTNKPNFRESIHFVTKEDLEQNKYTVYDMVLPMPGSEVIFPKNMTGHWYTDFLSMDGLTKTRLNDKFCIDNQIIMNSYYLRGAYRKVLVHLKDFKWDFKTYGDVMDPIIFSNTKGRQPDKGNEKLALQIEFTLPSDSYVFMALRELVDLNKSGLTNMYEMSRRYLPKEKKKEIIPVEKSSSVSKVKENPKVKERLDGGMKKSKTLRRRSGSCIIDLTSDERNSRSASRSNRSDNRRRGSRFDRSRSPIRGGDRPRSREVLTKHNLIEVRLTNDRHQAVSDRRPKPFQNHVEILDSPLRPVYQDPSSDFRDPFERVNPSMHLVDGVAMCEFRTEQNLPQPRITDEPEWDREERLERERRQREMAQQLDDPRDRRPEPRRRSPLYQSRFERSEPSFDRSQQPFDRNSVPFDRQLPQIELRRVEQSFDRNLPARRIDESQYRNIDQLQLSRKHNVSLSIDENFDHSRFASRAEQDRFEAGRLLQPPAWLSSNIRPDDLRNQLLQRVANSNERNIYDPEREFEDSERRRHYNERKRQQSPVNNRRRLDEIPGSDRGENPWEINRNKSYGREQEVLDRSLARRSDESAGYRGIDERAIIQERLEQINRSVLVRQDNTIGFDPQRREVHSPQLNKGFSPSRRDISPYRRQAPTPTRVPSPPIISSYRSRSRSPASKHLTSLPRGVGIVGNSAKSFSSFNRDEPLEISPNNNNYGPNTGPTTHPASNNNNWHNMSQRNQVTAWQNSGNMSGVNNFPPNNGNFSRGNFGPSVHMINNMGPQPGQPGIGPPGGFNNFNIPMPVGNFGPNGPNNFGMNNYGPNGPQQKISGFGGGPPANLVAPWQNQNPPLNQQQQPFQDRYAGGFKHNYNNNNFNNFGGGPPNQGNMGMRRF